MSKSDIYLFGILPIAVAFQEVDESRQSFGGRDILDDKVLPFVKADTSHAGPDIAIVGIRHLARSIHDTTHDTDLETL